MMTIDQRAADLAAKATGLRPDQIAAAVEEYRLAASAIQTEPEWHAMTHMSGEDWGGSTYRADDTAVILQIENWKDRGEWQSVRRYQFDGEIYDLFAEARSVELSMTARPKPRPLPV